MHSRTPYFWPHLNSATQSSVSNHHDLEHHSIVKPSPSSLEHKVSPRMHKLSDPQRFNQPVQAYLRLDLRLPNSRKINLSSAENFDNSNSRSFSRGNSAVTTPKIGHSSKQQKIFEVATTSCKSRPRSFQESIKGEDHSLNLKGMKEFGRKDFPKNINISSATFNRRISEAVDSNAETSFSPRKQKEESLFKKISYSSAKSMSEKQGLNAPQTSLKQQSDKGIRDRDALLSQQLTFRTNTAVIVTETEGKFKDGEDRIYCECQGEHCGFRKPKESRNKENLPISVCNNIKSGNLNSKNKETCSRRLDFEQGQRLKNTLKESDSAVFEDGNYRNKLDELNKEFYEKKQTYKIENQNKIAKSWSQTEIGKNTDITTTSLKAFYKESEVEEVLESKLRKRSFQEYPQQIKKNIIDLKGILKHRRESSACVEGSIERDWNRNNVDDETEYNEEDQLKKMVMELQKKITQKDVKISQLKSDNKASGNDQKAINFKFNQSSHTQKRLEDELEQISQQISCQEREIVFLNKCNERMEKALPNPEDLQTDVTSHLRKIEAYEDLLQTRKQETQGLAENIAGLELESLKRIQEQKAARKSELRRIELECRIRDQEIKQLNDSINILNQGLAKYENVEEKLIELDRIQNRLIEDNEQMRNKFSSDEKLIFQRANNKRQFILQAFLLSKELNQADCYVQSLVKTFELLLKEDKLPTEIYKLAKVFSKNINDFIRVERKEETELKNADLKLLIKKDVVLADGLYKKLINCMDDICEEYAKVCGNQCNLQ